MMRFAKKMTSSYIKILLVGDYSIFRSALRLFLETEKHLRVVGEASETDKAAEIIAIEKPDLVLGGSAGLWRKGLDAVPPIAKAARANPCRSA